ncbi:hypothetical protein [uncultured Psychroserpens sp.]|uniref:hypothetical protein n=1 Tax=uncultured Psychroserpens sp. TaxID=255436 RepID=UPI00262E1BE9|nr:hypothetical protein [uncultured Psychroserpens sp.]
MIVKSILIKNFKSYYGDIEFNFKNGLNIISGHEGSGKSNLFDAFMWVLFKRVSGMRRDEELDESNVSYINDKIKQEFFNESNEEDIVCEVRIKVEVPKNLRNNKDREYEIIRRKEIYLNKGMSGKSFYDKNVWSCTNSELLVKWVDESYNSKEITNLDAERVMDDIFPEKIRKYIWFQGEQLNELLDFDNKDTLQKAVDYISYLSSYEYMSGMIGEVDRQLGVRARNKLQANNRDKNKFNRLNNEFERLEKKIEENKILVEKKESQLIKLIEDEKEQNEKLSVLAGFPDLKVEEEKLMNKENMLRNKVSSLNEEEKNLFKSKWMLRGTDFLFEEADKQITKFTKYRRDLISQNDKQLEEGVPGDSLIIEMLEKKHCLICDRPASKGSTQYKAIQSHLDKNKDLNPLDPKIEELNEKIINLKGIPSKMLLRLKDINPEITEHESYIQNALNERNATSEDLKLVREKIKDIIREKGESILNLKPKNINSTLKRIRDDQETIRRQIAKYNSDILTDEFKYKNTLSEIKKLKNPGQEELLEDKLLEYTEFLKMVIKNQTETEKKELIDKIQKTANDIQRNIANVNNIVIVYVEIDSEDYSLKFVDADGNPNPGHGAQNTLAKMSIISAIVKLSNEQKGENYPFIADAPTSDFATEFTNRFLESISNTYNQSIIISKDMVDKISDYYDKPFVNSVIEIHKECKEEIALSTNSYTIISK